MAATPANLPRAALVLALAASLLISGCAGPGPLSGPRPRPANTAPISPPTPPRPPPLPPPPPEARNHGADIAPHPAGRARAGLSSTRSADRAGTGPAVAFTDRCATKVGHALSRPAV